MADWENAGRHCYDGCNPGLSRRLRILCTMRSNTERCQHPKNQESSNQDLRQCHPLLAKALPHVREQPTLHEVLKQSSQSLVFPAAPLERVKPGLCMKEVTTLVKMGLRASFYGTRREISRVPMCLSGTQRWGANPRSLHPCRSRRRSPDSQTAPERPQATGRSAHYEPFSISAKTSVMWSMTPLVFRLFTMIKKTTN